VNVAMRKIALLLALLLVVGATAATAQAGFRFRVGFGVPRPYVSGFLFVGRPAPLVVYRPYGWRPVLVYPRPFGFERVYVRRGHSRFRPYRPVPACWRHYRCGI